MTTASNAVAAPREGMGAKPVFYEFLWRSAGIQSVGLFIVAYIIYGYQPQIGATAETITAFYNGNRTRILISAALEGLAVLNLLWFAAALRTILSNAGEDGWGAAVTASSAVFGGLVLFLTAIGAGLAYSIAGSENQQSAAVLHDFSWALLVLASFPRAMLIMSVAFGLWRARIISNGLFGLGVAFIVLGVLGGTTWISGGPWAADGDYARFVSPALLLVWLVIVSWVLFTRRPPPSTGW